MDPKIVNGIAYTLTTREEVIEPEYDHYWLGLDGSVLEVSEEEKEAIEKSR